MANSPIEARYNKSWTEPLNYPGRCEDIVGQVVGPTHLSEHYIITEANYRSDIDITECRVMLMARNTETNVTIENQVAYTSQRVAAMSARLGYDMRNDLLPRAFRRDLGPAVPTRQREVMLPGPMGRELALSRG